MSGRNELVAMLLAGGQGSRLKYLTTNTAKPAVPFGGKYKIIDFALSNAKNSGIHHIGVLTQYKHFYLNQHIGIGKAWDFDKLSGGLKLLSPFFTEEGGRWYEGTANSVYENMDYLEMLDPEYVLILSADHIYKMNYSDMLRHHKENNADVSIAVMEVDWDEASRFGIMNTDESSRIVEFEEKPENPKSNLASMGIYIFSWPVLRKALIEDYEKEDSTYDFGHDIIPSLLEEGKNLYAYRYSGYWKDVGTVRTYWETNLELIEDKNNLNVYDPNWKIHTSSKNLPPHYVGENGKLINVLVNEACIIHGKAEYSVLFDSVVIEEGAEVYNSVLLPGAVVEKGAKICNCVVNENMVIEENQVIGSRDTDKVYLVSQEGILED